MNITHDTSGITVQGRQLHSFAFTTDAAIIRNTNADAILAVYPFTGEPVITQALLTAAQAPLFVGVGGGTTTGPRVIQLAMMAEMQGAAGVVLNAPAPPSTVYDVARITNTPVIATVLTCDDELDEKIEAGASIINVAAGRRTPDVVQQIRQRHPSIPLLASGGSTDESMAETTTPPTAISRTMFSAVSSALAVSWRIARYTDGSSPPAPNRRAANMLSTHAVAKAASWPRSGNPTRPARRTWPRCSA